MLQGSAVSCSQEFLSRTLDLFNCCDFVLNVNERLESSSSKSAANASVSSSSLQISVNTPFSRDGILMSTENTLGPLLKHVFKEVQRRDVDPRVARPGDSSPTTHGALKETDAADVEEFVAILQKSENYILAIRTMLSSRCRYFDKSKVPLWRSSI
jgi:hypothetical protein